MIEILNFKDVDNSDDSEKELIAFLMIESLKSSLDKCFESLFKFATSRHGEGKDRRDTLSQYNSWLFEFEGNPIAG